MSSEIKRKFNGVFIKNTYKKAAALLQLLIKRVLILW